MFWVSLNICNLIYWLVQGWIAMRTSSLGAIPGAPSPTCFPTLAYISLCLHCCLHFTGVLHSPTSPLQLLFVLYLEMDLDLFVLPFSLNSLSVHLLSITERLQPLGIEQTKQIIRNGNLSSELSDISLNWLAFAEPQCCLQSNHKESDDLDLSTEIVIPIQHMIKSFRFR